MYLKESPLLTTEHDHAQLQINIIFNFAPSPYQKTSSSTIVYTKTHYIHLKNSLYSSYSNNLLYSSRSTSDAVYIKYQYAIKSYKMTSIPLELLYRLFGPLSKYNLPLKWTLNS